MGRRIPKIGQAVTACVVAIAAGVVACAPVEPASAPVEPPARRATAQPSHALTQMQSSRLFIRRQLVETRAPGDDCSEYGAAIATRAWLGAWCAWRAGQWRLVDEAATEALRYFEPTRQLRRQMELRLLRALAASAEGRDDSAARARREARVAVQMWSDSRTPLTGSLYDRYGGDLPYLLGLARAEALVDAGPDPSRPLPAADALFEIAWGEYRSTGLAEALPHVARAQVRHALARADFNRAIERLHHALRLDERAERTSGLVQDLELFGQLAALLGVEEAGAVVAPWTASAGGATLPMVAPPWHADLAAGQAHLKAGRTEEAVAVLRDAVASIEAVRSRIEHPTLRQRFFADKRAVYLALVDGYTRPPGATMRRSARALEVANGLKARGLVDLLDGRVDPTKATEARPLAWRDQPTLRAASRHVRRHLARWQSVEHTPPDGPADLPRLEQLPAPLGLDEAVVGRLDADTAVVEYLVGEAYSYAWVLTDAGVELRRLAGRAELVPLVDRFLDTLVDPRLDAAEAAEHRRLAERLYVALVGPISDLIVDRERLVIAPDDRLYALPFEALARPSRGPKADYLVYDHAVSYAPSSAALTRLWHRGDGAGQTGRGALLVGSPDLDRPAVDLVALSDQLPHAGLFDLDDAFPPLPGTARELTAIAGLLDRRGHTVTLRTGAEATEHLLRTDTLTRYGLIHLAAHGISDATPIDGEAGPAWAFRQPALLLAQTSETPDDGVATLSELVGWRTAADVVVLSGCATGRGWRTLGEGAFGLAGAFLVSGSRNVVASTWNVADRNTGELMVRVYDGIAAGEPPAEALRRGQIAMLQRGGRPATPFSWASFRVIGGGL